MGVHNGRILQGNKEHHNIINYSCEGGLVYNEDV